MKTSEKVWRGETKIAIEPWQIDDVSLDIEREASVESRPGKTLEADTDDDEIMNCCYNLLTKRMQ